MRPESKPTPFPPSEGEAMILSVKDRLVLLGALPEAGDFVTLKVVMELRMELGLSAEEIETIELKQDGTLTR